MEMPILAKENSIIGFGNFNNSFEYDYLDGTEFKIYNIADGKSASASVYDVDANKVFEIKASRNGNSVEVEYTKTDKAFKVTVSGKTVEVPANSDGKLDVTL